MTYRRFQTGFLYCILYLWGIFLSTTTFSNETQSPLPRVLALSPHIVEMLYALKLEDSIIAVAEGSDYPKAALALPTLSAHGNLDIESIIRLKPDLVLAWPYGQSLTLKEQLAPFHVQVVYSDPKTFKELGEDFVRIAALFSSEQAQTLATNHQGWISKQLKRLQNRYGKAQAKAPVKTFLQIWDKPLRTLNKQNLFNDLLERCGGTNIFADAESPAPQVSLEAVIQKSPELIILSGSPVHRKQWIQQWRTWLRVPAVRHGHMVDIHPDFLHRPSLRTLESADILCRAVAHSRQMR